MASFHKDEKKNSFLFVIIKFQNKRNFQQPFIVQGKWPTSMEISLFSNALKAHVNEFDNTQEKDEKSWRGIEKDYLEDCVLV